MFKTCKIRLICQNRNEVEGTIFFQNARAYALTEITGQEVCEIRKSHTPQITGFLFLIGEEKYSSITTDSILSELIV